VYFFDQIRPNPVFDVMLHLISPTRREAASPPPVRRRYSKKSKYIRRLAVTNRIQGLRPTLYLSGGEVEDEAERWRWVELRDELVGRGSWPKCCQKMLEKCPKSTKYPPSNKARIEECLFCDRSYRTIVEAGNRSHMTTRLPAGSVE
jgi:hypothetical protein